MACRSIRLLSTAPKSTTTDNVAVTRFRNVPINEGDNRIEARLVDAAGDTAPAAIPAAPQRDGVVLERVVHFAGAPVHAELVADRSFLVADGITPSVLAVRLFDRSGAPVRPGLTGAFVVEPPFHVLASARVLGQTVGPKAAHDTYLVRDDGVAYIELQPTTESGHAQLVFQFDGYRTETVSARITAPARDWVLVGFGEGTVGYNHLSGNMEGLQATDIDRGPVQRRSHCVLRQRSRAR